MRIGIKVSDNRAGSTASAVSAIDRSLPKRGVLGLGRIGGQPIGAYTLEMAGTTTLDGEAGSTIVSTNNSAFWGPANSGSYVSPTESNVYA